MMASLEVEEMVLLDVMCLLEVEEEEVEEEVVEGVGLL